MILWSIKILILSIILIFVSHNLFGFFKDTLTTPKVKDLVNKPQQQYNDIMNTIKKYNNSTKQSVSKSVNNDNNVTTANNLTQNVKQQTMIDKTQMKDELKHFLNEIKNKPMQSSSSLSSSSNPSSIQSIDSFENSNTFIGNSYQNAYEQR